MGKLLQKIHLIIFVYAIYSGYMLYSDLEKRVGIKKRKIPVQKRKLKRKKNEWRQLQRYFKDIEDSKRSIEKVAKEVEKVQKQLPSEISDTENLQLIRSLAEGLNIRNILLEPLGEKENGFYITKRYKLKGTGTFLQFLIFFEKIGQNKRLLNVGEIELVRANNERRGRFQRINGDVTIEAYRYNRSHQEDRGIERIEEKYN